MDRSDDKPSKNALFMFAVLIVYIIFCIAIYKAYKGSVAKSDKAFDDLRTQLFVAVPVTVTTDEREDGVDEPFTPVNEDGDEAVYVDA